MNSMKSLKTASLQNTCGRCFCTADYPSYIDEKLNLFFKYMYIFLIILWFKIETSIILVTPKYGLVRSQHSRNSRKHQI